ncbi:MAG: hypothetical protein R3B90_14630 [Planctomycetaceae bacterium]
MQIGSVVGVESGRSFDPRTREPVKSYQMESVGTMMTATTRRKTDEEVVVAYQFEQTRIAPRGEEESGQPAPKDTTSVEATVTLKTGQPLLLGATQTSTTDEAGGTHRLTCWWDD